eukprot:ctg_6790.g679
MSCCIQPRSMQCISRYSLSVWPGCSGWGAAAGRLAGAAGIENTPVQGNDFRPATCSSSQLTRTLPGCNSVAQCCWPGRHCLGPQHALLG